MSTTAEILREARQRGIILEPDGEAIRYRAPRGRLTPNLAEALKAHKAEILAALRQPEATFQARVRGRDAVIESSSSAEVCWHCHGERVCRCAFCAVPGREPLTWESGQCGACKGTGYLCWPTEAIQ